MDLFKKAKEVLNSEPLLVEVNKGDHVVFVGDTHGELSVSRNVLRRYMSPRNKLIFLGDYVDRGKYSKENIDFLISQKIKHKDNIYLLQGNHEGYGTIPLFPDDFWKKLSPKEFKDYSDLLSMFPLVATVGKVIALHGTLPDLPNLEQVNKIKIGDNNWTRITWGDFYEEKKSEMLSRPQFGKDYFMKIMKRYDKEILVRSHQAGAPRFLFDDKCITIFSSGSGKLERNVLVYDIKNEKLNLKRI